MNDLASIDGRHTVTLVRNLPGPIERVWAFLTEPKHLARWLSDGSFAARVGGAYSFEMGAEGRITVFDPPRLLEYMWSEPELSRGPIVDTLVRWELAEFGDHVRLTLTHIRLSDAEAITHAAGWHALIDRLLARLDGSEPADVMERIAQLREEYSKRYRVGFP